MAPKYPQRPPYTRVQFDEGWEDNDDLADHVRVSPATFEVVASSEVLIVSARERQRTDTGVAT